MMCFSPVEAQTHVPLWLQELLAPCRRRAIPLCLRPSTMVRDPPDEAPHFEFSCNGYAFIGVTTSWGQ